MTKPCRNGLQSNYFTLLYNTFVNTTILKSTHGLDDSWVPVVVHSLVMVYNDYYYVIASWNTYKWVWGNLLEVRLWVSRL